MSITFNYPSIWHISTFFIQDLRRSLHTERVLNHHYLEYNDETMHLLWVTKDNLKNGTEIKIESFNGSKKKRSYRLDSHTISPRFHNQ